MLLRTVLVSVLLASPALAGQSEWQEVLPDVRMRLVAMPYFGQPHEIAAAIEIDMPASHKTYWRIAGDSGFPAHVDASQSTGVAEFEQIWPLPAVETDRSGTDYVYRGRSFLPFSVAPTGDDAPELRISAFVGICATVCMPVDVDLTLRLDDQDPDSMAAFFAALARVPAPWPFESSPIESIRRTDAGITLRLATDSGVDASSLVAVGERGDDLFGVARMGLHGIDLPIVGTAQTPEHMVDIAFASDSGFYVLTERVGR